MWKLEKDFQSHLITMLSLSRTDIEENYSPFDFINIRLDIKSLYRNVEEWRELKILSYGDKRKDLQNLWKGIGKVFVMEELYQIHLSREKKVENILSLPELDFLQLKHEIQYAVLDLVLLELVGKSEFYFKDSLV